MKKLIGLLVILFWGNTLFGQSLKFENLTCNSQKNPIAIDSKQPRFSWVVSADGFDRSQTTYQILVASKPDLLNIKNADLWNSGEIKSAQSVLVKYQGKKLSSSQEYWWKVRIRDEKGKISEWSPVNSFEIGLTNESDWEKSKWISLNKDTRISKYRFREYKTDNMKKPVMVTSQPVGYFRNEITTNKQIKSARAYICGLGYYELYINGKKTGDHVLDPAPSNYDKQAYYVNYDVTNQLKSGKNAFGIIMGNGFYGQTICWKNNPKSEKDMSYGVPAARILIKIVYTDNSVEKFYSNESWKASTGPVVFDNVYGGDTYDARFEIPGWCTTDFNDKKWNNVKVITPEITKVSSQEMPPVKKLKELKPKRIFKSPVTGKWIVDFGQNIAGWIKITVNEKEGQVIKIITTETLTKDGKDIFPGATGGHDNGMKQLLEYICKGGGPETWEPKFSYHGFRYAEISGISMKPDVNTISAILVATDVKQTGHFSCSDSLLNKMNSVSKWTVADNLHGIPEDCPHREKCGWLGDVNADCEYVLYNYDMANFYKKYMEDIHTQLRSVKGHNNSSDIFFIPTMVTPGKRACSMAILDWGVTEIYVPWYNYIYYGDSSIVIDYYKDMKDLITYYLSFKNEKGIIDNGLGDWCPPLWDRKGNPDAMDCNPIISANAYFYDVLGIMEVFADMNNDPDFKAKVQKEKNELCDAFNAEYLKPVPLVDYLWYGSQTATVLALQFGMVPEDKIEKVVNGLTYNIIAVKGTHHATGIHGERYIYTVLSKYGKTDLVHKILTTPTFPSQTYIMNYGFTTWPERQFYWDDMPELTRSLNHPMHSGFSAYFYESLGGIKSSFDKPGYKEFIVNPIPQAEVNNAEVSVNTPYGNINNCWKVKDGKFTMNLSVPFNTKARLYVSEEELKSIKINGISGRTFIKNHPFNSGGNSEFILLGSGKYNYYNNRCNY